jgi:AcrR family transcriptional regulator
MRRMNPVSPSPVRRAFRGQSPELRQRLRRERLIEAGLELFGGRGYHAVRVRDVCSAARLTERYFYESFPNLEALFLAVYDHAVAHIRAAIDAAVAASPADVSQMARTTLGAFLKTLRDEPRLARILLIDVLTVGTDVADQSRLATQSFAEMVSGLIVALYPDFAQRNLDAQVIANGLVGSTTYIAMQWAFNGFKEPLEHVLLHCAAFYEAIADEQGPHARSSASIDANPGKPRAQSLRSEREPNR